MRQPADRLHLTKTGVQTLLKERLPPTLYTRLRILGAVAGQLGYQAYLVGGSVRDLVRGRKIADADVAVEGGALKLARRLARQWRTTLVTHPQFMTATISLPDGGRVDLAATRTEVYPVPAALPVVRGATILEDLRRRDFTVNAMAIRLTGERYGTVVDSCGGTRDLQVRLIRILHDRSFSDDPTRVLRAVRLEQRLGFRLEARTKALLRATVREGGLARLSGPRASRELLLVWSEANPAPIWKRLGQLEVLSQLHPRLAAGSALLVRFASIQKVLGWWDRTCCREPVLPWLIFLLAVVQEWPLEETEAWLARLQLPRQARLVVLDGLPRGRKAMSGLLRDPGARPSRIDRLLAPLPLEVLLYGMAVSLGPVRRHISRYLTHLRPLRLSVTGRDVRTLGLAPGPLYRTVLEAVRAARVDGLVKDRAGELAFMARYVRNRVNRAPAP